MNPTTTPDEYVAATVELGDAGVVLAVANTGGNVMVGAVHCTDGVVTVNAETDGTYVVAAHPGRAWFDCTADDVAEFAFDLDLDAMRALVLLHVESFGGAR